MEKPSVTVKRMLKEIKKRGIFYSGFCFKDQQERVEKYIEQLAGEDLSLLSSTNLVDDYLREMKEATK